MATVVATADLHIDAGRYGAYDPATHHHSAWDSAQRCLAHAVRYAIDHQADLFAFAGDAFLHGRPGPEAGEMVADAFRALSTAGIPVVAVPGNHEYLNLPAGHRHALSRFRDLAGVTVADDVAVHTVAGVHVGTLPWPRRAEVVSQLDLTGASATEIDALVAAETLDRVDALCDELARRDGPTMLLGHATVGDAVIGSSKRSSEVLVSSVFSEPVLPVEVFERDPIQASLLGHIHRHQRMGPRTWYLGSPDRVDASEEHDLKGFAVVTLDDGQPAHLELEPTPARRFRTLNVDEDWDDTVPVEAGELVRVEVSAGVDVDEAALRRRVEAAGGTVVRYRVEAARVNLSANEGVGEHVTPTEALSAWLKTRDDIDEPTAQRLLDKAHALAEPTPATASADGAPDSEDEADDEEEVGHGEGLLAAEDPEAA